MKKTNSVPKYNFKTIERKWQERWERDKTFQPDMARAKKPFYNLMMFPYPSAEGLHVGNMYAFTGADTFGRYKKLCGYDVFEPIGLDGFGIHSENYAMKIGEHIKSVSERSEKNFYKQLRRTGNMYDWSRTVETYKPNYYKWTQWLFLQMFKNGLAYQKKAKVNWCPSCKTVLSDEQVIQGQCERCDSLVEKRELKQWFFKITKYADKLLKNLDWIDWTKDIKTNQRNWIGRSEGATINFPVVISEQAEITEEFPISTEIEVFTTRPDTLFGATYMVLAPEHSLIQNLKSKIQNYNEVERYVKKAIGRSEQDRKNDERNKTGIELKGIRAINPVAKKPIPIWVADYVLAGYGTGAIMAVPAHDQRDWEFAKKYNLEIRPVILPYGGSTSLGNEPEDITKEEITKIKEEEPFIADGHLDGYLIKSDDFSGMKIGKAKKEITKWLVKNKLGKRSVDYRLRDWCISRQRYWGPPIPIVWCKNCALKQFSENKSARSDDTTEKTLKDIEPVAVPVPENDLPVKLPPMEDFLPEGKGKGPLAKNEKFVNVKCPVCGKPAKRETDVSDPFVDSSWYFLRYPSTEFDDKPFDEKRTKKWLPVDSYIGGKEHTVLHLLYSRFVTMALKDLGHIDFEEPCKRFFGHGLISKDGAKMSKSKGNVVNPDDMIDKYGADTLRLYLRFLGDFGQGGDWRDSGVEGMNKFVRRMWTVFFEITGEGNGVKNMSMIDKTVKIIGEDVGSLSFNTAVARLMEYVNWLRENSSSFDEMQAKKAKETLSLIIAPMAPHVAEEMWETLENKTSIFTHRWPKYDENNIIDEEIELVIQINGKVRDRLKVSRDISEEEAKNAALESEKAQKYIGGQKVKKIIYVPGKLVSVVV